MVNDNYKTTDVYVPHHSSSCGSEIDLWKLSVQNPVLPFPWLDSVEEIETFSIVIGGQLSRESAVPP